VPANVADHSTMREQLRTVRFPRSLFIADAVQPDLYLDHVENDGWLLFEQIVKLDLEGMVCKRKSSPYRYSQLEGREELFEQVQVVFVGIAKSI
jgi:hypothetical protein